MAVNLDALQPAYRAVPSLDPNVHVAIANTTSDAGDAVTAAQSTQAMGQALTTVNLLKTMDASDQRTHWNSADGPTRQMWQAAGYSGPPKGGGGGIFGAIGRNLVHGVRDVIGAPSGVLREAGRIPGVGVVANGIADMPKNMLNAVNTVGTEGQHLYRAGEAIPMGTANVDNNGDISQTEGVAGATYKPHFDPGLEAKVFKSFFSPDAWARAWSATNKGERTFENTAFNRIADQNQGKTITAGDQQLPVTEVAAAMATGTLNDYAKHKLGNDANALGDLNNAVNTNSDLKAVVTDLNNHKLSFGRQMTPDSLWTDHPGLATALSGAGDAIFDIKSDPTLAAGKARKALMAVRYGIKTPEDVERVMATKGGQRWASDVADKLSNGDYAGVLNRFPSLAGAIPDLATKGIKTPADIVEAMKLPTKDASAQSVTDWLKSNNTASRILIGDGSAAGKDAILAPHISAIGAQLANVKDFTTKSIDWTKNVSLPKSGNAVIDAAGQAITGPMNLMGGMAKKMTTLLPEGRSFDPNGADALTFVQRFANTYLDKETSDKVVNAWASAGYNTAAKRNVYMDMLGKVFESAGMNNSDRGQQMMARYLSNTEQAFLRQKYAANGIDQMMDDGTKVAHGLTEGQLTDSWSLPSYKAMSAVAQRGTVSKIVYGVGNNELANSFNAIWKPAQLLRFGFPIRVSLDELTGGMLRNGAWNTIQARLAAPIARSLKEHEDSLDPEHKALADSDGNSALSTFAASWAQKTKYAMAKTGKAFVSDDYYNPIKWGIDNGSIDKGFAQGVSARHGGVDLSKDADTSISLLKEGIKPTKIFFRPTDEYRDYKPGSELFTAMWKHRLDGLAKSDVAKHILENQHLPEADLIRSTADYLQSPEWAENWNKAARSQLLSDGRRVGQNATADEAALDWATKLKQMVDDTVRGADGTHVHQDLIDHMLGKTPKTLEAGALVTAKDRDNYGRILSSDAAAKTAVVHFRNKAAGTEAKVTLKHDQLTPLSGDTISTALLDKIPDELRPKSVTGPEQVPLATGGLAAALKDFTEYGFDHIGQGIDWMARQPLYLHNFAAAHNELRPIMEKAFGQGPATEQALKEMVSQRAIRNTAPFIHNPEIRSQMNVLTQNFLPFQFAQEQFYKRWARTFAHSPEAIRKAQLLANSLSATGVVHDDGAGSKVFSYPIVGHAQKAVSGVLNALGYQNLVAVHGGFSGQLKMVAPGLDRTFAPSFGPLVTLPLAKIADMFPELQPLEGKVLGPIASSKSLWEQVAPASIARAVHLAIDQENTSTQYGSAMMKTVQDIVASKYDDKNPQALQDWFALLEKDPAADTDGRSAGARQELLDQIKNGTRINVALRALLGFAAPAAPQAEVGNTVFAARMKELQKEGLDFTTAMQQIVRTDPSMTPYAVFMSQGAGKEPLPATKDSLQMLDKYQDFFRSHPSAGGFLLPQGPTDSAYNSEAYRLQMAYEMRQRKTPSEFLDQIVFNAAAADYFDTRDDYLKESANLRGPAKTAADEKWAAWKNQYDNDHPQFAYMRNTSNSGEDRTATLKALQTAIADPRSPKTPQTQAISDLVDTYQDYINEQTKLQGRSDFMATNARKNNKAQMLQLAKTQIDQHPEVKGVYNSLIKTDLEGNS